MTAKFTLIHSLKGIEEAKDRLAPPERTFREPFALPESSRAAKPAKNRTGTQANLAPETAPRVTIGIWSLGAWLGSLAELIAALNSAQGTFVFFEVEAAVPSGLISRPERMIPWLSQAFGDNPDKEDRRLIKEAKATIDDNLIANDFFGLADSVRTDLGLDYLIGITPSMVAGESDGEYYWNHFSTFEGRTVLASSYDLHEFSRSNGLPLDAFLTKIIVSQFLVAMFWPKLSFHDNRKCLFDYDADRISLIEKVRNPRIEAACLEKIEPRYRSATTALVEVLRAYRSKKP